MLLKADRKIRALLHLDQAGLQDAACAILTHELKRVAIEAFFFINISAVAEYV